MNDAEELRSLFAAVARWTAATYGLQAESISIHIRGLTAPVTLPIFQSPAAPANVADVEERGPAIRRCVRDILATLREHARPLTKTRLLEEMWKRNYEWSESSVCRYLAELMQDGTIENPEGTKIRGYRLPADS